jgi:hypothetical protein
MSQILRMKYVYTKLEERTRVYSVSVAEVDNLEKIPFKENVSESI